MTFSIVIATHGHERWRDLAWSRAYPSAQGQGAEVLIEHDPTATRAEVRNRLIEKATGKWIITLDADDELAPDYVAAMEQVIESHHNAAQLGTARRGIAYRGTAERGLALLLTPRVSYVRQRRVAPATFWPEIDLQRGNWMVVGTAAPRDLMLAVGGWRVFMGSGVLNEWDDWDMWIRCVQAGAEIVKVPDAVYIAHVSSSPGYTRTTKMTRLWLKEIRQANGMQWK